MDRRTTWRRAGHGRLWLLAGLLTGACAHLDTGQVDYRIAEPPSVETGPDLNKINCKTIAIDKSCEAYQPARLMRRYMASKDVRAQPIPTGAIYSIELDQGMIGDNILEGHFLGRQLGKTGEFAILANVFEFADDAKDSKANRFVEFGAAPGDLKGEKDPSDVELKLVYFSRDVKKNQPFGFSSIPLLQRSRYGGGSIGVQIVIMEIDANGPMRALLGTLARFGQQAVPGASEVKDMIFDLGESIFSSTSQDDMLLNYRFVLSADGGGVDDARAVFAPGRYVVRRSQERTTQMSWDELRLDHNSGRMFHTAKSGLRKDKLEEVRKDLYLTLNVKTYPSGTKPEFYTQDAWTGVRKSIEDAADVAGAPIKAVTADIAAMVGRRRSEQWSAALEEKWAAGEAALTSFARLYVADADKADLSACVVDRQAVKAGMDRSERDALDAINAFVALYRIAAAKPVDPADKKLGDEFAIADRDALVSRIARWFMPWSDNGVKASFADHAAFETAFVTPNDAALGASAIATAKGRGATPTCDDLLTRGLAEPKPTT